MNRVVFNGEKGSVKYRGKLLHKVENAKIKADEEWLGVEWDDPTKGKHNGTVEGVQYFQASAEKAGSLVLAKKAEFGQDLLEALVKRYFRDHEVNEILKHKDDIVNYLKSKWEKQLEKNAQIGSPVSQVSAEPRVVKKTSEIKPVPAEDGATETKKLPEKKEQEMKEKGDSDDDMFEDDDGAESSITSNKKESRFDAVEKLQSKIKDRDCYTTTQATTEFDEDAIIRTFKNRFKKIEFKGFDKIWERIYNMDRIIELCLSEQKVANFGQLGSLNNIVSSLKNLTLENNLLHNWSQILILGSELRKLETLSVSYNNLRVDSDGYDALELQSYNESNDVKKIEDAAEIFPTLTKLIAITTGLNFRNLNKIVKFMPKLQELVLCKNQCNDFDNMHADSYKTLVSLNLEDNCIDDHCRFGVLGELPNLRDLALNHNKINRFQNADRFQNLENLNISHNAVIDGKIITDLRVCKNLKSLKINYNPIEQSMNKKDITRRAVAEISSLTRINAMDLNKYERKDCEYYFLRWVFHEYFTLHHLHQLSYKYNDFCAWATENYPAVFTLIEKYENPYPEVDVSVSQEDKSMAILGMEDKIQANRYSRIIFSTLVGPLCGKPPIAKIFPKSTDFLYIRNWVSQTFKIKNKELIHMKFKNTQGQVYEPIEDLAKTIEFYDIKDNADLLVEEK